MNAIYRMPMAGQVKRQPYTNVNLFDVPSRRRYIPSRHDYIQKFYRELSKWRSETRFTSSLDEILEHESYHSIVGMGDVVKELLVFQLRKVPGLEVYALEDICGYTPYGDNDLGNIEAMTNAWIAEAEGW